MFSPGCIVRYAEKTHLPSEHVVSYAFQKAHLEALSLEEPGFATLRKDVDTIRAFNQFGQVDYPAQDTEVIAQEAAETARANPDGRRLAEFSRHGNQALATDLITQSIDKHAAHRNTPVTALQQLAKQVRSYQPITDTEKKELITHLDQRIEGALLGPPSERDHSEMIHRLEFFNDKSRNQLIHYLCEIPRTHTETRARLLSDIGKKAPILSTMQRNRMIGEVQSLKANPTEFANALSGFTESLSIISETHTRSIVDIVLHFPESTQVRYALGKLAPGAHHLPIDLKSQILAKVRALRTEDHAGHLNAYYGNQPLNEHPNIRTATIPRAVAQGSRSQPALDVHSLENPEREVRQAITNALASTDPISAIDLLAHVFAAVKNHHRYAAEVAETFEKAGEEITATTTQRANYLRHAAIRPFHTHIDLLRFEEIDSEQRQRESEIKESLRNAGHEVSDERVRQILAKVEAEDRHVEAQSSNLTNTLNLAHHQRRHWSVP